MRPLAVALAAVVAIVVASTSCLVNTRSKEFECSMSSQCEPGRTCDNGFCVLIDCPADCDTCNVETMECLIVCNDANGCRSIECPSDFHCTIACTGTNACDEVDCQRSASCNVMCSGSNTCADVICGDNECTVTCNGTNACESVDCASSCRCDLTCGANSCTTTSCPMAGATECTVDGTACSSNFAPGCNTCL